MATDNPTQASAPDGTSTGQEFRVDQEHFSVRLLVPILTIGSTLVWHVLGMNILGNVLANGVNPACIVLPVDVAALIGFGMFYEWVLKYVFPSRRFVMLTANGLVMRDERRMPPVETVIDWEKTVNVKAWRFTVRRRRTRIPRGWYCMALHLLQDDAETIVYTFMPEKEAEALASLEQFVRLRPRKETESSTDLSAVAEQRRLLKLEDARWEDGAELERDDFRAVLAAIEQQVSEWMI
ncbi:MAG: hypothetical protein GYB65_10495 [Chloroflexi bacterium]|nr:hypothetical protein [Chloroflexota bacterium]